METALIRTAEATENGYLILADWLEEQGRCAESEAVRNLGEELAGQAGFSDSYDSTGDGDGGYGYDGDGGYGGGNGGDLHAVLVLDEIDTIAREGLGGSYG